MDNRPIISNNEMGRNRPTQSYANGYGYSPMQTQHQLQAPFPAMRQSFLLDPFSRHRSLYELLRMEAGTSASGIRRGGLSVGQGGPQNWAPPTQNSIPPYTPRPANTQNRAPPTQNSIPPYTPGPANTQNWAPPTQNSIPPYTPGPANTQVTDPLVSIDELIQKLPGAERIKVFELVLPILTDYVRDDLESEISDTMTVVKNSVDQILKMLPLYSQMEALGYILPMVNYALSRCGVYDNTEVRENSDSPISEPSAQTTADSVGQHSTEGRKTESGPSAQTTSDSATKHSTKRRKTESDRGRGAVQTESKEVQRRQQVTDLLVSNDRLLNKLSDAGRLNVFARALPAMLTNYVYRLPPPEISATMTVVKNAVDEILKVLPLVSQIEVLEEIIRPIAIDVFSPYGSYDINTLLQEISNSPIPDRGRGERQTQSREGNRGPHVIDALRVQRNGLDDNENSDFPIPARDSNSRKVNSQNATSEMNLTTVGLLSSILDEDLQSMDIAMIDMAMAEMAMTEDREREAKNPFEAEYYKLLHAQERLIKKQMKELDDAHPHSGKGSPIPAQTTSDSATKHSTEGITTESGPSAETTADSVGQHSVEEIKTKSEPPAKPQTTEADYAGHNIIQGIKTEDDEWVQVE